MSAGIASTTVACIRFYGQVHISSKSSVASTTRPGFAAFLRAIGQHSAAYILIDHSERRYPLSVSLQRHRPSICTSSLSRPTDLQIPPRHIALRTTANQKSHRPAIMPDPISLAPESFPHVWDNIIANLDINNLIPLRQVSSHLREKVEERLARHIVISMDQNAGPFLPTSPLRPFPKSGFWQSSLKGFIEIVDYVEGSRDEAYSAELSDMAVDVVRSYAGEYFGYPIGSTRQWIAWLWGDGILGVIGAVTERVVIVMRDRPSGMIDVNILSHTAELVIIFEGDWWKNKFDYSSDTTCTCDDEGTECSKCIYRSYQRGIAEDDAVQIVTILAELVVSRNSNSHLFGKTTVTLVDLECFYRDTRHLDSAHEHQAIQEARYQLIRAMDRHLAVQRGNIEGRKADLKRVKFMTREEYRDHVGAEQFELETEVGYGA